jgi:nucleotide-binding universal stress UspA family protein
MAEIVVGYDGSGGSRRALEHGADLAAALGDSLRIVYGYAPHGAGGGEVRAQREAVEELGEQAIGEATKLLAGRDGAPSFETELLALKPAEALVQAAIEHSARMIVVGTHGESALRAALIGSTPYKLIHQTDVPVLVVPAEEK